MSYKTVRRHSLFSMIFLFLAFFAVIPTVNAAVSDGFDFPVGKPDGTGWKHGAQAGGSDGWDFLEWATYPSGAVWHPGEDWNWSAGGCNTDLGQPVYAA